MNRTEAEQVELDTLRAEQRRNQLGDRTHAMSAAKLRRLIELEDRFDLASPPKEWAADRVCVQCGNSVEEARRCYAHPTCFACLPPPAPLPVSDNLHYDKRTSKERTPPESEVEAAEARKVLADEAKLDSVGEQRLQRAVAWWRPFYFEAPGIEDVLARLAQLRNAGKVEGRRFTEVLLEAVEGLPAFCNHVDARLVCALFADEVELDVDLLVVSWCEVSRLRRTLPRVPSPQLGAAIRGYRVVLVSGRHVFYEPPNGSQIGRVTALSWHKWAIGGEPVVRSELFCGECGRFIAHAPGCTAAGWAS